MSPPPPPTWGLGFLFHTTELNEMMGKGCSGMSNDGLPLPWLFDSNGEEPVYSPPALSLEEEKIGREGEARALSEVSRKFCRGTVFLLLVWAPQRKHPAYVC